MIQKEEKTCQQLKIHHDVLFLIMQILARNSICRTFIIKIRLQKQGKWVQILLKINIRGWVAQWLVKNHQSEGPALNLQHVLYFVQNHK
jgi:hypothetical protein